MPELPEVQCFANDLNEKYVGLVIREVRFRRANLREPFQKKALTQVLVDSRLQGFSRIGKRLVLHTEKGLVAISLGMTGTFVSSPADKPVKHEHVTLIFANGITLGFVDPRRFGSWEVLPQNYTHVAIDALNSKALLQLFLSSGVANSSRPVKTFLMDQNLIGGVGNIYALEALFLAGVRPTRLCARVSLGEWGNLAKILPRILREAIKRGGSSIASYKRFSGDVGGFQRFHKVYGRDGELCAREGCSGIVHKVIQAGRSSWYCPICQK